MNRKTLLTVAALLAASVPAFAEGHKFGSDKCHPNVRQGECIFTEAPVEDAAIFGTMGYSLEVLDEQNENLTIAPGESIDQYTWIYLG